MSPSAPRRMRLVLALASALFAAGCAPEGGAGPAFERVVLVTRDVDGSSAAIEITDTGVGISEPDLDAVFDRFHKGPTSTGSGLGLTISRDLVEAHGGSLAVESTSSSGTVIRVTLPRQTPA